MNDETKAGQTRGSKVGAPQFALAALLRGAASTAIHDYKKKQRNRRRNKAAARSRTVNRNKGKK